MHDFSKYAKILITSSMLALGACGGGSSDSDSGSGSSAGGSAGGFAGTYNGTGTATISAGGASESVSGGFVMRIQDNGTVQYIEAGEVLGNGKITGNAIAVPVAGSTLNGAGISCTGRINYTGTAEGVNATGKIASSGLVCNGVSFKINGNWRATKSSSKAEAASLTNAVRSAISNL